MSGAPWLCSSAPASLLPKSRIFVLTLLLLDRCVISNPTVMMAWMSRIVRRPSVPLTAVTSVIGT